MNSLCPYLSKCTGCHYDTLPYTEQTKLKLQHLDACLKNSELSFSDIQFISCGENYLRDRFDFTIETNKMGLYGPDRSILDIDRCLQLSPELQQAYEDFRKVSFPIKKGSVRLRVDPDGNRGAWLDFANADIKNLLEDGKSFQQLLDIGFQIEIGQKGKALSKKNNLFKLVDPIYASWFKVNLNNYVSQNLQCLISSFTQPSWKTADALVEVVHQWLNSLKLKDGSICEFGSGIGQFTLPLLSYGYSVDVYEFDRTATELVLLNAQNAKLDSKLNVFCDDFQKKPISNQSKYNLALVNPPRSGLKNFVHEIVRLNTEYCIYISCFPESLATDLKTLAESGYEIKKMTMVDQFPQTKHFETCVLLQRINTNA